MWCQWGFVFNRYFLINTTWITRSSDLNEQQKDNITGQHDKTEAAQNNLSM